MFARIAVTVVAVVLSFAKLASAGVGGSVLIGYDYREFQLDALSPNRIVAGPDGAMWFTVPFRSAIYRMSLDGSVQTFPLEDQLSSPLGITTGPDGNLWFTDTGPPAIGRISTTGMATEFPLPGLAYPIDIDPGPDGNLWFTTGISNSTVNGLPVEGGTIGRITPNGTISIFPLDYPTYVLTPGPDRALWVTTSGHVGRVTTNGQAQFFAVDGFPAYIAAGPDGALWFTTPCPRPAVTSGLVSPCDQGLGRLTTSGQLTRFPEVEGDSEPTSIVRGPEDNLWFVRNTGRVSRITPAGRVDDVVFYNDEMPNDIAVGPDGALWVTLPNLQRIARVASVALDFIHIANSGPLGMAPGLDGSVWFADADGNRVGHITRGRGLIQYELGDTHGPTGIAAAPDGGAFFTNFDAGTIGRITPDGDIVEYALPFPDDLPEEIVLGPDGNYWFTIDVNSIGRITPLGVVTIFPTPTQDAGPLGIAVGSDGNLWFTEQFVNKIGRMTTNGEAVDFPIPTPDSQPWDIAAGPDGNLYFTESRIGRLARITTDGRITELGVPNPATSLRDIALGPDGAMWFSVVPMYPDTPVNVAVESPRPGIAEDPTPTPTLGPAQLGRLAPDGRITSVDIKDDDFRPGYAAGIAGGADGQLFVALYNDASIAVVDLVAAQPVPTATPTEPGGEATPTQPFICPGDCDGNHVVTIAELITAVRIALNRGLIESCSAVDTNRDGQVLVNELIAAVRSALTNC